MKNAVPPATAMRPTSTSTKRFRLRESTRQAPAGSAPAPVPGAPGSMQRHVRRRTSGTWPSPARRSAGPAPERAQRVGPAGGRRRQRRAPAAPIDQDDALDDLAAHGLDGGEHREERAAGRQDVVDEEHTLAGLDAEAAPELARGRPVVGADLLGEDAPDAQLPGGLEGEDDAAGRRAGDQVDHRLTVAVADVRGEGPAQLARRRRIGEDRELLDIGVAVAAALEQEMALAERPGRAEQRFGPGGDRRARGGIDGGTDGGHVQKST